MDGLYKLVHQKWTYFGALQTIITCNKYLNVMVQYFELSATMIT